MDGYMPDRRNSTGGPPSRDRPPARPCSGLASNPTTKTILTIIVAQRCPRSVSAAAVVPSSSSSKASQNEIRHKKTRLSSPGNLKALISFNKCLLMFP